MTEENQEPKPLKLKLAGNRSATEEKGENTHPAKPREDVAEPEKAQEAEPPAPEPQQETAVEPEAESKPETKLKPRLKPRPEPEEKTEASESGDAESIPEAKPKPKTKLEAKLKPRPEPEENAAASESDDTPAPAPAPTPPASETPKESAPPPPDPTPEPEKPAAQVPPPLPVHQMPSADDALEEALDRVSEGEKSSHNPLLSIVIILALLGILGGSGFGLWYVLKGSSESDVGETVAEESNDGFLNSPINKAKEAISTVPVEQLEEVMDSDPMDSVASSPPAAESKETAIVAPTDPVAAEPATPEVPSVNQELVQAVSAYLSEVHIGGVRTGERPMVIIDGAGYTKGELVEPGSGLRFSGIRNGKLAFTDEKGVVYLKSF